MSVHAITQESAWWVRAYNRLVVRGKAGDRVAAHQASRAATMAHFLRSEGK